MQNGAVPAGEAKQQPSKDEARMNAEAAVVGGLVKHMILRETTNTSRKGHTAVKYQAVKHAAFKHDAVKHDANCRLESGTVDEAFYTFGCRPERLAAAGYAGCKGGSNVLEEVVDAERLGGMDEWDARQTRPRHSDTLDSSSNSLSVWYAIA